jgi:hypothetical protein
MRDRLTLGLCCFLLLKSAGAAIFPDYPVHRVSDYKTTTSEGGLALAAETVDDLQTQKKYFSTELTPKGFLPVMIVMENRSAADSFVVQKSGIAYGASSLSTPDARSKTGERLGVASLAALSLGGALIAAKLISNASKVQQNIVTRELQSRTLSPGSTAHGFLYVPVPKKAEREPIRLRIPVTRVSTGESLTLELIF